MSHQTPVTVLNRSHVRCVSPWEQHFSKALSSGLQLISSFVEQFSRAVCASVASRIGAFLDSQPLG
jgi:hypothetical protein